MAPSRYDWKIVDWDVKPQHNQPTKILWENSVFYTQNNDNINFQAVKDWLHYKLPDIKASKNSVIQTPWNIAVIILNLSNVVF